MLAADYSQLELRVIAHLSQDRKLISILNAGGDVFKTIAAQWKGVDVEDVTGEQRQQAKQVTAHTLSTVDINHMPNITMSIGIFQANFTASPNFSMIVMLSLSGKSDTLAQSVHPELLSGAILSHTLAASL